MADNQLGAAWAKLVAGDDVPLAKQHEYKLQHPIIVENVKMAVENLKRNPFIIDDGADEGRIAVALREVLGKNAEIYHLVRQPELKSKTEEITKDFNIMVVDSLGSVVNYADAVVQNVILSTLGELHEVRDEIEKMAYMTQGGGQIFVTTPNFYAVNEQFSTYRAEPQKGHDYCHEGSEYNLYLRGETDPVPDIALRLDGGITYEYGENDVTLQEVKSIPDKDFVQPDGTVWEASEKPAFYLGIYQKTM